MSMIEKFLKSKHMLKENLAEVREEALRAAEPKADALIEEFIAGVKAMVVGASDEEFVDFITSGKLDDEDLNAAIMFRAEARREFEKLDKEVEEVHKEAEKAPVHVFVLEV